MFIVGDYEHELCTDMNVTWYKENFVTLTGYVASFERRVYDVIYP